MATNDDLAELLFPEVTGSIAELEERYPERHLPAGAEVTRFAPSPTGFLHTGSLFTSMIGYTIAKQSHGVFYFRLEDTDTKRTIEGSGDQLIEQLKAFGLEADEGYTPSGDNGNYGPYQQSLRKDIYKIVIKELIRRGRAYPDFATTEDLEKIRAAQEANKVLPGYYGAYARDRNLTVDERIARIKAGTPWVIRYRSNGDHDKKTSFVDAIRGKIELQDNDVDVVILKSDGLPTYHFAHVCDDHFMHTTHITRGEEWLPSLPIHFEMFRSLGWKAPKYAHLSVIMKMNNGTRRKLSKRKDPEASVDYFLSNGYEPHALLVYLMTIANSNYEDYIVQTKDYNIDNFKFSLKKMSLDGALFDNDKLNFYSKEILGKMTKVEITEKALAWSKEYSPEFYNFINKDKARFMEIINIEREKKNPRKDYAKYSEIYPLIKFFSDEEYLKIYKDNKKEFNPNINKDGIISFLNDYKDNYDVKSDEQAWFKKVKEIASKYKFCGDNKVYKENPSLWNGNINEIG